uniref:Uncharacterized protein n=1 Tax=Oryza meridionalis TaxID=40149 RepID=A0A0E0CSR7_9ORYZ
MAHRLPRRRAGRQAGEIRCTQHMLDPASAATPATFQRVNDPIALEVLSKSGERFHYMMNKKNLVCWWPRRPNNRAIFEG